MPWQLIKKDENNYSVLLFLDLLRIRQDKLDFSSTVLCERHQFSPLWFMKVWRWPAKPLVLFISGWLQSALGKEVFLWQKKQKVFIHSICSNVDPREAFEENQSG